MADYSEAKQEYDALVYKEQQEAKKHQSSCQCQLCRAQKEKERKGPMAAPTVKLAGHEQRTVEQKSGANRVQLRLLAGHLQQMRKDIETYEKLLWELSEDL